MQIERGSLNPRCAAQNHHPCHTLDIEIALQSESRGLPPHYPLWARDQHSEKVQPCCSRWLGKLGAFVSGAKRGLLPWSSLLHSPIHGKQKEKATALVVITLAPSSSSCPCSGTALPPQPGPQVQLPGLAVSAGRLVGQCWLVLSCTISKVLAIHRWLQSLTKLLLFYHDLDLGALWTCWKRYVHEGLISH